MYAYPCSHFLKPADLNQASCASGNTFREEPVEEFQNPALFDLCDSLERPRSPSISAVPLSAASEEQDDDAILGDRWLHRITPVTVPRTPFLQPHALEVIYFDVFGTLIDQETGIFKALEPLLSRSSYEFPRHEALAFYFEVESDLKKRTPELLYVQVLARTYTDMAMRLGLSSTADESFVFACSLFRWPLFDDAVQTLQALRSVIPILVGIVDMDFEGLGNTAAFRQLKPYFERIFSWDQFHAYRPDPPAVYPPLMCPSFGVPRSHRCFVSSALFRDLEPACHADIPAIWLRRPGTLAANLPTSDASFVWRTCDRLTDLASAILVEKGALRGCVPSIYSR
ncbi:HAD-like domain-containing protein [Mycena vitilis]|nr:HAD-like domain-containing protein [Mycena vitilis]